MDSFKSLMQSSRRLSKPRGHYLFTILFALILTITILFFFASDHHTSPVIFYTSLASRLHSPLNTLPPLSAAVFPDASLASQSYRSCTVSAAPSAESAGTYQEVSRNTLNLSGFVVEDMDSCDVFDGQWIKDEGLEPFYKQGSCPFIDDAFNCFKNGRPDSDYLKLKWKPHACELPRFDGLKMLEMLRGKQVAFVGDSLNRNMWESLVCALRESLADKTRMFEGSGGHQFRSQRFYSFKFKVKKISGSTVLCSSCGEYQFLLVLCQDFNCSIDFIKSPFLVQQWKVSDKAGTRRETLRLDLIESYYNKYLDADIIVFNTGHWWTHKKTFEGKYYFQEGNHVHSKLEVAEAYKRALRTWAQWVDANINSTRTTVVFQGYSSSHFKGGRWNTGGSCHGEMTPITNNAHLAPYPWMMRSLESVISKMKTPVFFLNITRMTDYRRDGHPSIYRQPASTRRLQDCSHWCLPGVPDSWNEILYAILIKSQKFSRYQ